MTAKGFVRYTSRVRRGADAHVRLESRFRRRVSAPWVGVCVAVVTDSDLDSPARSESTGGGRTTTPAPLPRVGRRDRADLGYRRRVARGRTRLPQSQSTTSSSPCTALRCPPIRKNVGAWITETLVFAAAAVPRRGARQGDRTERGEAVVGTLGSRVDVRWIGGQGRHSPTQTGAPISPRCTTTSRPLKRRAHSESSAGVRLTNRSGPASTGRAIRLDVAHDLLRHARAHWRSSGCSAPPAFHI
jgi:hypothetical protein